MTQAIRWGILGTGNIAHSFATGLQLAQGGALTAVGSRTLASAERFAAEFGFRRSHGSYEELANDPEVDVVYVATPHPMHRDNSLLCLGAGKAVLCEKPFTINAREAAEVIGFARERGLFLMEAMWTRFLPVLAHVRALLAEGAIGEPRLVEADFGFRAKLNPHSRLFDPKLGGGALLDVGVYPVALASMVFGSPSRIVSMGHLGETGVDEQGAIILGYAGGQLAVLSTAIRTNTPHEAVIMGTQGRIKLNTPWWKGASATLTRGNDEAQDLALPYEGNGYQHEAEEVMRCLRAGKLESETMRLDETLSIMKTLDEIRGQWGLRYPME